MEAPLVSVVLPTYNRARTLRRAINSVLNQTYAKLELIVVDDGSRDDTPELVSTFDDPRLRYVKLSKNGGVARARNVGIQHATGELIAFQDSDDEWLNDKLERQVATLANRASSEKVCVFHTKIMYVAASKRGSNSSNLVFCIPSIPQDADHAFLKREVVKFNLISTQTLLLTRGAIEEVGGFDENLANNEDWDFAISLIHRCEPIFIDTPLVMTYLQNDSVSHLTRKGARSQLRIAQKLNRASNVDLRVVAKHFAAVGWWLCKLGNPRNGRRLIRRSLHLAPMAPKSWAQFFVATALIVGHKLSGRPVTFAPSSLSVRSSDQRLTIKRT